MARLRVPATGRTGFTLLTPEQTGVLFTNQVLSGPPGNPTGIGASLRLLFGPKPGPAREIHAGSGDWSQDSAGQVMATPQPPTQIQVRWPGGKTTQSPVPAGAKSIVVNRKGEVNVR